MAKSFLKCLEKTKKQEEAAKNIPLQSLMNYILKIVSQQLIMSCIVKTRYIRPAIYPTNFSWSFK